MSTIQMSSGYPQQNLNSANGVQVENETAVHEPSWSKRRENYPIRNGFM